MRPSDEPTRWHIDDGEEARLTPGGEAAATIVSRGSLPFRVHQDGNQLRPDFPGTAVLLGGHRFEVVTERLEGDRTVYLLSPWPSDQIIRTEISYGPGLIREAQEERRRARVRHLGRRFAWPFYPILGLLPEDHQDAVCERLGLDPATATLTSGLTEAAAVPLLLSAFRPAAVAMSFGLVLGYYVSFSLLRALGAVAFGEVAGSVGLAAVLSVARRLRLFAHRLDERNGPFQRSEFWRLLETTDSQRKLEDGSILVESLLPHLTWTPGTNLKAGDGWWAVSPVPPQRIRGRVWFRYVLSVAPEAPACEAPSPTAYQGAVLDQVAQEWLDLRSSGFDPLISLLPREVQQRAVGREGGPASLRRSTVFSVVGTAVAALWFGTGWGPLNMLTGLVLAFDAALRALRLTRGEYAPSVLGSLIADYLRPERVAFQAHRRAVGRVE